MFLNERIIFFYVIVSVDQMEKSNNAWKISLWATETKSTAFCQNGFSNKEKLLHVLMVEKTHRGINY